MRTRGAAHNRVLGVVRSIYCGTHIVIPLTDYTRTNVGRVRAPPSSFAISAVAAANMGRGGLCSAVWGIPEYRLSGVALSGTHGVLHDIMTYRVLQGTIEY